MELAPFIRSNEDVIVADWEAFAHTSVPSAAKPNGSGTRKPRDGARKREARVTAPPKPMPPCDSAAALTPSK